MHKKSRSEKHYSNYTFHIVNKQMPKVFTRAIGIPWSHENGCRWLCPVADVVWRLPVLGKRCDSRSMRV
ncbi:hypothetical protein SETIT_3G287600v2 [Setaria italica]|uniref:Uncharacterized protein n=1 Tax=Setaria italica TaxID=4555 RepID=A0A368QJY7_SETIT|nr:hypothetical protein SETIT_3G287600v2 [Setaria italica]